MESKSTWIPICIGMGGGKRGVACGEGRQPLSFYFSLPAGKGFTLKVSTRRLGLKVLSEGDKGGWETTGWIPAFAGMVIK